MRGEERDPCPLLSGEGKSVDGDPSRLIRRRRHQVTYFEDPDGPQPPPVWDDKDLQSVLALFRLAYVLAAGDADDGTPRRDKGNEPTRGDEL